jgi:hypothetical protein
MNDSRPLPDIPQPSTHDDASSAELTLEQKQFLFQTISEPAAPVTAKKSANVIAACFQFMLHNASLTIVPDDATYDAADEPLNALAKFYFHELSGCLERHSLLSALKLSVSLKTLHLDDLSHAITSPVKIIGPKRHSASAQVETASPALPFLSFTLETHPADVQADVKFRLVSQPLEVTLLPNEIMQLVQFIRPKLEYALQHEHVLNTSSFIDADLQVAKFKRKGQRMPILDVLLEVSAPQVSSCLIGSISHPPGALLPAPGQPQLTSARH